ncbi:hypothetical protein VDR43_10560, partial [Xanthomonas campestris pv. campestris]|nr:hypothetical protein [Xanthomonas campestris pv. campestris]
MDNNIDVISALARQETNFIESVRSVALVRRGNKQAFQTAKYVNHLNESPLKNPQSPNARKALMSAAACQNYQ